MNDLDQGFMELATRAIAAKSQPTMIVEFFLEPVENPEKSKEAGRLICEDVEYVSVRIPGDSDEIRRPSTQEDRDRYPAHYAAFRRQAPQETADGTPLTKWPGIHGLGRVREAAALGIHTVEHLAAVHDGNLGRLGPGWRELRQKARDYLEASQDGAILLRLRSENDELRARLATLEDMVQRQAKEIAGARGGTLTGSPSPSHEMEEMRAMMAAMKEQMASLAPPKGKK